MKYLGLLIATVLAADCGTAEIRDVLKSRDIDAMFGGAGESHTVHETRAFAIVFRVADGEPGLHLANQEADEIWFVRSGQAQLSMGGSLVNPRETSSGRIAGSGTHGHRRFEIGGGDIVNLPRNTPYQLDPGAGRLEYTAVRVFPSRAHPDRRLDRPSPMDDVVNSSARDAVFADNDTNQPLHSVRNLSVNYVIYTGRPGPWESHRGCADIYFVRTGRGTAHLGGEIMNPVEEAPGETRGTGVTGARAHEIGPGDIVLIPHNTAHYVVPTTEKLGYNLVKVWAQE